MQLRNIWLLVLLNYIYHLLCICLKVLYLIIDIFHLYEGHLTAKSDVYSFGVVLLEMLTGRRVLDKNRPPGEHNLIEWAKPYLGSKRRILHVMDARIEGQYTITGALKAATLAVKCLSMEPKNRPNMDEVVRGLEQLMDLSNAIVKNEATRKHLHRTTARCTEEASRRKGESYPRPLIG